MSLASTLALVVACAEETTTPPAQPAPGAGVGQSPPAPGTDGTDAGSSSDEDSGSVFTPPPTWTSFTYSEWSTCHYGGTQVRTVESSSPPGCYSGGPVLRQPCTFTEPTDGAGLYEAYCYDCHVNGKKGRSASTIQGAIDSNRGGMNALSFLTPEKIALIASAK